MQLISDIHLEFYKDINILDFVSPCAPYLAICGDLGYPHLDNFKEFITQASKLYTKVFYVSGNHEYYTCKNDSLPTIEEIDNQIETICNSLGNVYYLNDKEHLLTNDIVILGTTLWTDIPEDKQMRIQQIVNDYRYIYTTEDDCKCTITSEFTTALHNDHVKWLTKKLEEHKDKKVIILTHHLPSFEMISEMYKGSDMNYAFASDLDYLIEKYDGIKFWLCGHTHSNMEVKINNCICITNPLGYKNENKHYNKERFIHI